MSEAPKRRKRTLQSVVVARSAKGKRVLVQRAPRKEELVKPALFLHAGKSSGVMKARTRVAQLRRSETADGRFRRCSQTSRA